MASVECVHANVLQEIDNRLLQLLKRQEVLKYLAYYFYLLIEKYHSVAFHNFPTDIDKIGVLDETLCIRTYQKVKT